MKLWTNLCGRAALVLVAAATLGTGLLFGPSPAWALGERAMRARLDWPGAGQSGGFLPQATDDADGGGGAAAGESAAEAEEPAPAPELSADERKRIQERLKIRRGMVQAHQALAFISAGSIIATEVFGIINDNLLQSEELRADDGQWRRELEPSLVTHRILAGTSLGTYLGAGIMAWTMPRAYRLQQAQAEPGRKRGPDSGKVHAALSVVHGIAMATVFWTGVMQANVVPAGKGWETVVAIHETAGFVASGFIITSAILIGTL